MGVTPVLSLPGLLGLSAGLAGGFLSGLGVSPDVGKEWEGFRRNGDGPGFLPLILMSSGGEAFREES